MEFFALSSVNNAFWSWAIYLMYRGGFYEKHPIPAAMAVFLIVFVSPLAAALVTALFRQRDWAARFIDSLGFKAARHNTTAWDFKFSSTAPVWVNVLLKDGNRIYGWFGTASFAGDSGPTADLYLERTLEMAPDGETAADTGNHGIWIATDQIATIDFIGETNGTRQNLHDPRRPPASGTDGSSTEGTPT